MPVRLVRDGLWEVIEPLFPICEPSPDGGRPPVDNRTVFTLLVFRAKTGLGWRDLPTEMGASQCTVRRRLKELAELGLFQAIVHRLLSRLKADGGRPGRRADRRRSAEGPRRRRKSGPNPTDRGRCGSKLNVMADRHGTTLAVIVSAANEYDVRFLLPLVFCEFPKLGGTPCRPREKPEVVRADQGYTSKDLLGLLGECGIEAEIPQLGKDDPTGLGRLRWPVE